MQVTVCGKKHLVGNSKSSGRPYDFTLLYLSYNRRDVVGQFCCEKILYSDILAYDLVSIGSVYDVDLDDRGVIVDMVPAVL